MTRRGIGAAWRSCVEAWRDPRVSSARREGREPDRDAPRHPTFDLGKPSTHFRQVVVEPAETRSLQQQRRVVLGDLREGERSQLTTWRSERRRRAGTHLALELSVEVLDAKVEPCKRCRHITLTVLADEALHEARPACWYAGRRLALSRRGVVLAVEDGMRERVGLEVGMQEGGILCCAQRISSVQAAVRERGRTTHEHEGREGLLAGWRAWPAAPQGVSGAV